MALASSSLSFLPSPTSQYSYHPTAQHCQLSSPLRLPAALKLVNARLSVKISFPRHRVTILASGLPSATVENVQVDQGTGVAYPPFPQKRIVVGCGGINLDYLASVEGFPEPDEKVRSTDLKVQGGGNVGNASTTAVRLGLKPRIISKVANDSSGKLILEELQADGIDTSYIVVSETGTSPFTYVIVDRTANTRTCIHSPGTPPMDPKELSPSTLDAALSGASLVYFDGRLPDTAILVAKEAAERKLPILVDAERIREGMDELLAFADYAICSTKFAQAWTKVPTLPEALLEMAIRLPQLKFVITTLGASGCVMLERLDSDPEGCDVMDVDKVYNSLVTEIKSQTQFHPYALASKVGLLKKESDNGDAKEIVGRLILGTAEKIPSSELVDTTGSGDAFIGSVLYALCAGLPRERMLSLAAVVAGANCRGLGARAGLPKRTDSRVLALI